MANSTGKAARKRYGTRFSAKGAGSGSTTGSRKKRRTFGKLPYSVAAGNVPAGAVNANDALVARIFEERRRNGWDQDANVAVPGPTRASVEARVRAEEHARPQRRHVIEGDDFYFVER